ncbi:YdcF family protein [Sansalvadorimonas verongulae]|uniref:YdcF family protein n=1 Tax=Sansalvadorimonas verongulae TaxID=2172824 RepID=UPI0018AD2075|nr:YdcF family protein [Sansalvadorimonas verongulae]
MLKGLETGAVFHASKDGSQTADAIVILGTGVLGNTPEYDMKPQPGALLIQRLRYGLKLHKETGLPILVSGGSRYNINEAQVMKAFLEEHGATVRWTEADSRSTRDNARNSAALLGQSRVLLVTHAWHMRRAAGEFERAGFEVTRAPTARFGTRLSPSRFDAWLPDVRYLRKSQLALHEYTGMAWYWFSK